MKILIIGTGAEIPPVGWGAVEAIIHEHLQRIPKFGAEVDLVNTFNYWELATLVKEMNKKYDFIHFHYDILWLYAKIISSVEKTTVGMSSHFPYITNEDMYSNFGFWKVMSYFTDNQHDNLNFCISQRDIEYFRNKGVPSSRLYRMYIGAPESISFTDSPLNYNKSIYLGKMCSRKRQSIYGGMENIDFVGNIADEDASFDLSTIKNYLGEWSKDQVYTGLTNYANLILLSNGENTPLVVREALMAGCGVVVSETSANELEEKSYITVIPDSQLDNIDFVRGKIEENKEACQGIRKEIREYGVENFGWDACTKKYLSEVERAVSERSS
jgi:glycosyltransferase involved in cell wall biosynthesis